MKNKSIRWKNFLAIFVLLCLGTWFEQIGAQATNRVLLRDVEALTLRRGEYTNGQRSKPVPQLQCTGGTAKGRFAPKVVQCVNRGFDGIDVQWECKAEMGSDYEFGKISVSCEGYEYANDPYILAGSCGLNYELDYSSSGAKKGSYDKPGAPYDDGKGINFLNIAYFLVACFVIYLIYTSLCTPRQGNEGDRRTGSDHGHGYPPQPPGWRPSPPPPPPSYDESCNKGTGARPSGDTGTAGAGNANSGPGFFTGMGLGALGGYFGNRFFGNGNTGYGGYGNSNFRRRNNYGYNQFERDTGFHNNDYEGPSTSTGYFGGRTGGGGGGSSGTHTSTGFGGTTRR